MPTDFLDYDRGHVLSRLPLLSTVHFRTLGNPSTLFTCTQLDTLISLRNFRQHPAWELLSDEAWTCVY